MLVPGETVVLHQGTWHWGPFPIRGARSVRLLNVQGRRYAEDNASVDLSGSVIEVRPSHLARRSHAVAHGAATITTRRRARTS